jgi:hypothetical protein
MDMSDSMGWGMGFGWMGILFWVVVILAIPALLKYLFMKPRRKRDERRH